MIKVKISTPWNIDFDTNISKQLKSNFKFDFADSCKNCDFWVIWGGIKTTQEKVFCPPQNVIYVTDEVHEGRFFYKAFLDQFPAVFTCRPDINHSSVIFTHELNTWMVNGDFDTLFGNPVPAKTKLLSLVCSDQTWLPGHKLRFAFVNKLIGHFKDRIDVFGRGFNPIDCKNDALAPYKYSVAIENSVVPGYFTEKIADCYLMHTLPLYYGCPDIDTYFDPASYMLLNPADYKGSISKIEALLEDDPYEQLLPALQHAREKYLFNYHIFNALPRLLSNHFNPGLPKQKVCIKAENTFERGYSANIFLKKVMRRLPAMANNFQLSFKQADLYANPKNEYAKNIFSSLK